MSGAKPSLGRLKDTLQRSEKADPAMDAGVSAAMLFDVMWGVGHALLPDTTWYGALGAGLGGMFLPVVGGAAIAGATEDALGSVKAGGLGFTAGLLAAAVTTLRWYPAWFVPLTLIPALGVFVPLMVKAARAQGTAFGFDAATTAALAALPDDLPKPLRARVDAAMGRHGDLLGLAQGVIPAEVPSLSRASAAAVRALAQQVEVVHRLAGMDTETLRAAHAEALAGLAEVEAEQVALLDATGLYVTARRDDRLAKVREQAEHLRLTAGALGEIARDVEG